MVVRFLCWWLWFDRGGSDGVVFGVAVVYVLVILTVVVMAVLADKFGCVNVSC